MSFELLLQNTIIIKLKSIILWLDPVFTYQCNQKAFINRLNVPEKDLPVKVLWGGLQGRDDRRRQL